MLELRFLMLFVAAASAGPYPQQADSDADPQYIAAINFPGTCPPVSTTTVLLQPVFYSEFFPYNTVIDVFRNNALYTITNAPTTIISTSTITKTILSASTTASASEQATSSLPTASNQSSQNVKSGTTSTNSLRTTADRITTTASSSVFTDASISSSTSIGVTLSDTLRRSSTISLPSSSASQSNPATLTTTRVTTDQITRTAISTATSSPIATGSAVLPEDLFLGKGLPSGALTELPEESFIFIAFTTMFSSISNGIAAEASSTSTYTSITSDNTSPLAGRLLERQVLFASSTASPVTIVDLSSPTGQPAGVGKDTCDGATPLLLQSGSLLQFGTGMSKHFGADSPVLGFLNAPGDDSVNVTFSLNNGLLQWEAPDTGLATFYSCAGVLFAAFGDSIPEGCQPVVVGAIAGRACSERVQLTRSVEPTFTAPVATSTASSETQVTTSAPDVFVTITLAHTDTASQLTAPFTSTLQLPSGTIPGTVAIYTPYVPLTSTAATTATSLDYVTLTLPWTGSAPLATPLTSTIVPAFPGSPGTVAVYTPVVTVIETTQASAIESTTSETPITIVSTSTSLQLVATSSASLSSSSSDVITTSDSITSSAAVYVTITVIYTATASISVPITRTVVEPSGGIPGTVEVQMPGTYITQTQEYTGTDAVSLPLTSTVSPAAVGTPGVVVVYTAQQSTTSTLITTSSTGQLTSSSTAMVMSTTSSTLGPFVTITVPYTGTGTITAPITLTIADPSGMIPGTVEVQTPPAIITTSTSAKFTSSTAATSTSVSSAPSTSSLTASSSTATSVSSSPIQTTSSSTPAVTTTFVSTSSTTTTAAPTTTPIFIPPPPKCGNAGLAFAIQNHTFYNSDAPQYSNVNITYFRTEPPLKTNTTEKIGFYAVGNYNYYSKTGNVFAEYKALNHRGYLYAPMTGAFNFSIYGSDDITFVWLGPKAYTNYTRANSDMEQNFNGLDKKYTFTLQAGTYTPMRIITVNGQGPGVFNMKIVSPAGIQVLGPDTNSVSDYIVQQSCDGVSGPVWPAFGSEVFS